MYDEKLIHLVRMHPVLYDVRHLKYTDAAYKNNIWTKIGQEMKRTGLACKYRWRNIRDNYRKSLKKSMTLTGKKSKCYKYSEQLIFLKKCFRDKMIAIGDMSTDDEENEKAKNNETQFTITSKVESPTNELSHCHAQSTPKQIPSGYPAPSIKPELPLERTNLSKNFEATVTECLKKENEPTSSSSILSPADPVDAFLSGIAPALKKLPPRHWHHAKAEIFASVQKYEFKMLMEEEKSTGPSAPMSFVEDMHSGGTCTAGSYKELNAIEKTKIITMWQR